MPKCSHNIQANSVHLHKFSNLMLFFIKAIFNHDLSQENTNASGNHKQSIHTLAASMYALQRISWGHSRRVSALDMFTHDGDIRGMVWLRLRAWAEQIHLVQCRWWFLCRRQQKYLPKTAGLFHCLEALGSLNLSIWSTPCCHVNITCSALVVCILIPNSSTWPFLAQHTACESLWLRLI